MMETSQNGKTPQQREKNTIYESNTEKLNSWHIFCFVFFRSSYDGMDKSIHPSITSIGSQYIRDDVHYSTSLDILCERLLSNFPLFVAAAVVHTEKETCLEDFVILLGADWRRSWRQERIDWKLLLRLAAATSNIGGLGVRLWRCGYHRIRVSRNGRCNWCLNWESRLDSGRCPTVSVILASSWMLLLLRLDSIIFVGDSTAAAAAIAVAFVSF